MLIGRRLSAVDAAPTLSARARVSASEADREYETSKSGLGLVPNITLAASLGVLLVSIAEQLSRLGLVDGQVVFWLGLVVIVAPILARQLTSSPSRAERVGLLLLLGVALYLVKVASNPQAFTFSDELTHTYNVEAILQTGHLFHPNPLVDVTALYPGLASVGAALTSLTGLSVFQAGVAVAAVARLITMLAVFLVLEQVSESARLGGIAATLYAGHPNFLFYSAEFSYETLALPLAGLVVLAALRRASLPSGATHVGWTLTGLLAVASVTITHHLTSYALAASLCAATLVGVAIRHRIPSRAIPWDLALAAVAGVVVWFATVANPTSTYLGGVLGPAAQQGLALLFAGQPGRQLFQSAVGAGSPLWQQLVVYASVLCVAAGLAHGLWRLPRKYVRSPIGAVVVLAAALYLPVQALRLTQAGWETANRSSEFLFLGTAFVLAIAASDLVGRARAALRPGPTLLAAIGVLIVLGGAMTGWPYALQIPPPYLVVAADGQSIEPEDVSLARWVRTALGPDNVMTTDPSNALMMGAYGFQRPFTGQAYGVQSMLLAPYVDATSLDVLRTLKARYVVMDRRVRSWDHSLGFYPPGGSGPLSAPSPLLDPAIVDKFDALAGVNRIADTGSVVVYDMGALDDALR